MSPRPRICSHCLHSLPARSLQPQSLSKYASTAKAPAITPAPPLHPPAFAPPIIRHPHNQPPSHRRPEERKSQLHRQYTSLLRSTPLLIFFQHNNLKATEWMAIRRELMNAMRKTDAQQHQLSAAPPLANSIQLQIITTRIFEAAVLVVDHFRPPTETSHPFLTHALSRAAHDAVAAHKATHELRPILSGPLAVLSFPTLSPAHAKAALSILSPHPPGFPAPTRRANPAYHHPTTQAGLQKLLLLGARAEGGRVLDAEGTRWAAGMEGGMEGLRAQLVGVLGGVGAGVTGVLEGAGRSLYVTLEGRRGMLEEGKGEGGT